VIGLDTNVLLRYLMQDDPVQSSRATELIEGRLTEDNPGFLSIVAVAEIAWVLKRAYRLTDAQIVAALERMVEADVLVIENTQEVITATALLKAGRGAFADALIGARGAKAGCARTATFDKGALRLPGFAPV